MRSSFVSWGRAVALGLLLYQVAADVFNDPEMAGQKWIFDMINIEPVWEKGIFGKGIRVRLNDQGIDSSHEEFRGRFDVGASCRLYEAPFNTETQDYYQHGTIVASLLGARGNNNGCSVGIAPGVIFSSCLSTTTPEVDETAEDGTWLAYKLNDMDISNNSYGTVPCISAETFTDSDAFKNVNSCPFADRPTEYKYHDEERSFDHPCKVCTFPSDKISNNCARAIYYHCSLFFEWDRETCTEHLDGITRSGQCSFFNEDETVVDSLEKGGRLGRGGKGIIYVFSSGNQLAFGADTNFSGRWQSRFIIYVGAVGRDGMHTQYSTPGASLFVTAPIGDRDDPLTIVTARAGGGCQKSGSGTSFSTPIVSGVIALMLDANPDLSWRDVQGIIASTSRVVTHSIYSDETQVVNGAGLTHSHLYGFGIVNALAAVTAAQNWDLYGEEVEITRRSSTIDLTIGDNPNNPAITQLSIDGGGSNVIVENVEVVVYLRHLSRGHLKIILTSPEGTVSELTPGYRPENGQGTEEKPWTLRTVRSWGEKAGGTWSLSIADTVAGDVSSCVDIGDWQIQYNDDTFDCALVEWLDELHDQEEADWLRFLFVDKDITNNCCVCGGGYWSGGSCQNLQTASDACDEAELYETCYSGRLDGYYQRYKLRDSQDRTVWDACCVAGGGNVLSDPNSFRDRLVRWELRVYGHGEVPPTQPPTRRPTQNPTKRPTSRPTQPPTPRPTQPPTPPPVARPTDPPTRRPTQRPTQPPTPPPVVRPTDPPTRQPTQRPTRPPTLPPVIGPTDPPTKRPTRPPTNPPTERPTPSPVLPPTRAPIQPSTNLPCVSESLNFPLQRCFGDCDTDIDCEQGLVCFQRSSFTAVPSCSCGEEDPSNSDYCVGLADTNPPVAETNDLPLSLCEGDCDTNLDCLPGLVCYQRSAREAVPGCVGGEEVTFNTDYCVREIYGGTPTDSPTKRPSVPNQPVTTTSRPTPAPTPAPTPNNASPTIPSDPLCVSATNDFPLALCHGDCDNDWDCEIGLYCYQRDSFGAVPGCSCGEFDGSLSDYCISVPTPPVVETNNFPLGLCEGECDTDRDCQDGLVCHQRNSRGAVPGCFGGEDDSSNHDYCILSALYVEPVPLGPPPKTGIDSQTPPPTASSFVVSSAAPAFASPFAIWTVLSVVTTFLGLC